jgi:hypothetical protein
VLQKSRFFFRISLAYAWRGRQPCKKKIKIRETPEIEALKLFSVVLVGLDTTANNLF